MELSKSTSRILGYMRRDSLGTMIHLRTRLYRRNDLLERICTSPYLFVSATQRVSVWVSGSLDVERRKYFRYLMPRTTSALE